jgi:hypothetical protein
MPDEFNPFPDLDYSYSDIAETIGLPETSIFGNINTFGQDNDKIDFDKLFDFSGNAPVTGSDTYGGNTPVDKSWMGDATDEVNDFGQSPSSGGIISNLAGKAMDFLGTNTGKTLLTAGLSGLSQAAKDKQAQEVAQMAIDYKKQQQADMNNSVKSYTGIVGNVLKNKG